MADRLVFAAGGGKRRNGFIIAALLALLGAVNLIGGGGDWGDGRFLGAALVLLAVGFAVWVLRSGQDNAVLLVLSPEGVAYRDWGGVVVPWSRVERIYARGGRLRRFLCLELRDAAGYLDRLPPEDRQAFSASPLVKPPVLLIPYGAVDATPQALAEAMEGFRARALAPGSEGPAG